MVFFRLLPGEGALGEDGDFLPGRGDKASDWVVEVGYRGEHDDLDGAREEAKGLARDLPPNAIYSTHERLVAILDRVSDPEDLEDTA